MTLVRVLLSLAICSSLAAFAQNSKDSKNLSIWDSARQAQTSKSTDDAMGRMHLNEFRTERNYSPFKAEAKNDPIALHFDDTPGSDDGACFTMRTYVVARDSKHSDATHLVGYSTCQKASRYRLRTTQIQEIAPSQKP